MGARAWAVAALAATALPCGELRADDNSAAATKDIGLHEARGNVQDVDKEGNRVTVVPSKGSPLVLQVDKTTTIFIDGRTGALDEIKAGAEIRASFEAHQGSNRAQWIEVSKKEKKPGPSNERPADAPPPSSPAPRPANNPTTP